MFLLLLEMFSFVLPLIFSVLGVLRTIGLVLVSICGMVEVKQKELWPYPAC